MQTEARRIDGKKISQTVIAALKHRIAAADFSPGLGVVLVGNDPASALYVNLKKQAAEKAGIIYHLYRLDETASEKEVIDLLEWLNRDHDIDAILVQLPVPKQLSPHTIIRTIRPDKDVDGFHPENIKKLLAGKQALTPGLDEGILTLLESTNEPLKHARALVIGSHLAFTQSLSYLLKKRCAHVQAARPDRVTAQEKKAADIIIVAAGREKFITGDMIKKGCILIDVGINKRADGSIAGDVDWESCKTVASHISPVPGGVGPLTIAMLLKNTVVLAETHKRKNEHVFST